jgi:hypothetical protein
MSNFTAKEIAVLTALIEAYEFENNGWGSVYLDNAAHGLSDRSFAGVAGSLTRKGVYNDTGDCFCEVKLDALDNLAPEEATTEAAAANDLDAAAWAEGSREEYLTFAMGQGWSRSKARRAWRKVWGSMYS